MEPLVSTEKHRSGNFLLAAIAVVVAIAGLHAAQSVLAPFLMAAFLAVICYPPLSWLIQRDVPHWLALLIVIGVGVLVILLVLLLIGTSVADFTNHLDGYKANLNKQIETWTVWLDSRGIDVSELRSAEAFDTNRLVGFVKTIMGPVGSLFSNIVVVLLIFAFMLVEASEFPAKIKAIGGGKTTMNREVDQILKNIRSYVSIKSGLSFMTGVLVTVWLAIVGVDYALLWGLLAFFFNFIPNIGSIIAAIPPVMLAVVQPGLGLGAAAWTAGGYVVINGVIGNVLEPRVMGRGLGLSTLVVFLSLIFWGSVLGPVGMLLSVPLTIIVKIVLAGHEKTRWIAILLAANLAEEEANAPSDSAQTDTT